MRRNIEKRERWVIYESSKSGVPPTSLAKLGTSEGRAVPAIAVRAGQFAHKLGHGFVPLYILRRPEVGRREGGQDPPLSVHGEGVEPGNALAKNPDLWV